MIFLCTVYFQPCVSVGNVGQLAVDLLISTLELEKVGRLHSECVLPVVGNDPFSEKSNNCSLMTAIEGEPCYVTF